MDFTSLTFSSPPQEPDAPVFVDADVPSRSISWRQYVAGVQSVAVGLRARGLNEQDCVALLSRNDIYISILGDAVAAAGAIFSGLPAEAKESELADCCNTAQVKWLFAMPDLVKQARNVARRCGMPDENVLIYDPPGLQAVSSDESSQRGRLSSLMMEHDQGKYSNPNHSKDNSNHVVSRFFTSGTTGAAKAVDVSSSATIKRIQLGGGAQKVKKLHFIGMHHVTGTISRQQAVAGYHRMHVSNAKDPREIIRLVQKFEIESVLLPPRIMIGVLGAVRENMELRQSLQSLRYVSVAGSYVPNDAMKDFQRLLAPEASVAVAYGCTEMGYICQGVWGSANAEHPPGYIGRACSGVTVRILEPDSQRVCGPDLDGEICIRSDQCFSCYYGNQEATKAAFIVDELGQHWFRSGDKGRITSAGEVCVTGRYKEVFKVGTEEVAPAEVETVLLRHEGVKDAAVLATEDRHDRRYYEVQAFIVPSDHKAPTAQELVDYVAATLSPYKAPTGGVTMVGAIARNSMKKVVTKDLQAATPQPGSTRYLTVSKS